MMEKLSADNAIFVFGSNLGGRHGAGAALYARQYYGAIYGQGAGFQGKSYAIPTKDGRMKTLPLSEIEKYVTKFINFAMWCEIKGRKLLFNVTPIGCGLAGYTPEEIAPMFKRAVEVKSIALPKCFLEVLENGFY